MNKNDLFRAFDGVDDDILERSEASAPRRKALVFRKWGALAACLALAVGLVGAGFAAEAREYSAAVDFFEQNGLSTEGLSRADVKAVYRDIVTESFTNDKTAQVLERAVPGWEISQREPTPEELAALWDRNVWRSTMPETGFSYSVNHEEKLDETLGFYVLDKSTVDCYQDGELLWTVEFPGFVVEDGVYTATFLWTMYHLGKGWDVPGDEGVEQEGNMHLRVTAAIKNSGVLDLDTISVLLGTGARGPLEYSSPIEELFPS